MSVNPLFPRKFCCPVCQAEFSSLAVRSSSVYVEKKEPDFHTVYKGDSPVHYSIIVCPTCFYAASTGTFNKEIAADKLPGITAALYRLRPLDSPNLSGPRDSASALASFQFAIRSAQLKQVPAGELAGLVLGASWMARETDATELEETYAQEALKLYIEAYNRDARNVGNLKDIEATYLIGELYRRNGDYREAISWFNKVVFHRDIKKYPHLENMARDQWSLTRELAAGQGGLDQPEPPGEASETPIRENPAPSTAATPEPLKKQRRSTMQMPLNLYQDQLDWLSQIVNQGYDHSRSLVSKEQVVRALLDAVMEITVDLPKEFSNEEQLKECFCQWITERGHTSTR